MPDRYTHGHHESVLRSHLWRTAENSAAHLLPHLRPGLDLLDVGCGPGTITLDLAARVAPGSVVGVDAAEEVVARAEAARAEAGAANVRFEAGDAYELAFADESFDVAHAHQVLHHLIDPVRALREMRRVLRPGGLLATRETDYGAYLWAPDDPRLDRWLALFHQVAAHNGGDADAGRRLKGWVQGAGFDELTVSSSTWTFTEPEDRSWWGGLWADRVEASSFAEQAVEYGFSDQRELAAIATAWRNWIEHDDALFVVVHCEVLARR
jgi:SAM-dependent methyltransferase